MRSSQTMPALVFEAEGRVTLLERPAPDIGRPDEVVVDVTTTGICGTDRGIVLGEFPATPGCILGHEAVGVVSAAGGGVRQLREGDRVVVNPTYVCGGCRACRRGAPAHCTGKHGRELGVDCDGTMAAHVRVEAAFVHRLPPQLPDRAAVLIEPLACVLNNLEAAAVKAGDHVLVAGAGPIGTLCGLVLGVRAVTVTVVDRETERLRLARSVLPAAVAVVPVPPSGLGDLFAGPDRPGVIIDTTGSLLEDAVDVVEAGGTVVVMGERRRATATVHVRSLVVRGISVVGAGPYPPRAFTKALELAPDLGLEALVSHEVPLESYAEAFGLLGVTLEQPGGAGPYGAMKVLLTTGPART